MIKQNLKTVVKIYQIRGCCRDKTHSHKMQFNLDLLLKNKTSYKRRKKMQVGPGKLRSILDPRLNRRGIYNIGTLARCNPRSCLQSSGPT